MITNCFDIKAFLDEHGLPAPHHMAGLSYAGHTLYWYGNGFHVWVTHHKTLGYGSFYHQNEESRGRATTITPGTARSFAHAAELYQTPRGLLLNATLG